MSWNLWVVVSDDEVQPMSPWRQPLPSEPVSWLREIASAYLDARETIPFGDLIGHPIEEDRAGTAAGS